MPVLLKDILALIGGIGVIIIGLLKLIGGVFSKKIEQKDKYQYDRKLEELKDQFYYLQSRNTEMHGYYLSVSKDKGALFNNKQFEIYSKIRDSLFQLKLKGDLLWEEVTSNYLQQFGKQLKKTTEEIGQYSLFIEENDYEDLKSYSLLVISAMAKFDSGKLGI